MTVTGSLRSSNLIFCPTLAAMICELTWVIVWLLLLVFPSTGKRIADSYSVNTRPVVLVFLLICWKRELGRLIEEHRLVFDEVFIDELVVSFSSTMVKLPSSIVSSSSLYGIVYGIFNNKLSNLPAANFLPFFCKSSTLLCMCHWKNANKQCDLTKTGHTCTSSYTDQSQLSTVNANGDI